MLRNWIRCIPILLAICCQLPRLAAQAATASPGAVVPGIVNFSGSVMDADHKPLTALVGITFYLYKDEQGGAPLWMETQNVQPDPDGHYSVTLGSTTSQGLPAYLFASGEARWLGVQVQGQPEPPRVLLVSVPYALKAGDAQTVGGLPASAFMLAAPPTSAGSGAPGSGTNAGANSPLLSGSGTANFVPLWVDSNGTLGNSALFQGGTAQQPKIGIGNTKPTSTLDVKGSGTIRGPFSLPSTGTATAAGGKNSQPLNLTASAFNSGTGTAANQNFQWQAEAVGNNTASAAGSLNLLFGQGSNQLAETGLNIAGNGQITFAAGQIFPGTGNGTITGVTAGTDLMGGGSSGNVTLNIDTSKVVTAIAAGTDLTGGGTGGVQTLSLDTSKVPQLNAANAFSSSQTINGNILLPNTTSGGIQGVIEFGGTSFIHDFGPALSYNAFFGYGAGNFSLSASALTAVGDFALAANTTGSGNTATGFSALVSNTTGANNTAVGDDALFFNTTGSYNTASGIQSLYFNTTGQGNTANGTFALLSNTTGQSNTANGAYALYLNTTGNSNTALGSSALQTNTIGYNNIAVGASALFSNTDGYLNTAIGLGAISSGTSGNRNTAVGFQAGPDAGSPNLTNSTAIGAYADVSESNALVLGSIAGVNAATANTLVGIGTTAPSQSLQVDSGNVLVRGTNNFQKDGDTANLYLGDTNNFIQVTHGTGLTLGTFNVPTAVRINQYSGFVGIGTTSPDALLSVSGSADKPGGGSWATFSDARLKNLNGGFTAGLSQLMKLHPIRYRYKEDNVMGIRDRDEHIGFVAQDVQRVIPEAVTENSKGYLLVNNDPILWTMLNAIQEQQREITALRSQLRTRPSSTAKRAASPAAYENSKDQELRTVRRQWHQLQNHNALLEARLARLEQGLNALSPQTVTVATATKAATHALGMEGESNGSPSR